MAEPRRTSALAHLRPEDRPQAASPGIVLAAIEGATKHSLRGNEGVGRAAAKAVGLPFARAMLRAAGEGESWMLRLGPDEWLLVGVDGDAVAGALAGKQHALVDITERLPAISIRGPAAREVLAGACPLDLDPALVAPGFASRTVLGKADVLLQCAGDDAFVLHAGRSFLDYLWHLLVEIGREHGVRAA